MTMTSAPRIALFSPETVLGESLADSAARAGMALTVIGDWGTTLALSSVGGQPAPVAETYDHLVFAPRFPLHGEPIGNISRARLKKTFEDIYFSFFHFVNDYMPALRDNGRLAVLLASDVGLEVPGRAAEASATAAVRSMAKILSLEAEDRGIVITTVLLSAADCQSVWADQAQAGRNGAARTHLDRIADAIVGTLTVGVNGSTVYPDTVGVVRS